MIRQHQRKEVARKGRNKQRAKGQPLLELLEQREVLNATLRFDFGTATSPVTDGFTQVTEATKYSDAVGYGWTAGNVISRDRGGLDAGTRDFNASGDATFAVKLANGTYNVAVTLGDLFTLHDQDVYLQGQKVESVVTKAGQFVTRTYTVSVSDGQLGLRLYGLGGLDEFAVINSLVVTPVNTPVPPAGGINYQFDFGTATSPVAAAAVGVSATRNNDLSTAGWRSGQVDSRDRGGNDPLTRDFHVTRDGLFGVPVPNGTYTVTITLGDQFVAHDQVGVFLEDLKVDTVTTAKGQFAVRKYTVKVTDGELSLRLRDLGGSDAYAVINGLSVTSAATAPAPLAATFSAGGAVNEGSPGSVSFSSVSGGSGGYTYSYDFDNDGTFEISNSPSQTAVVPSAFLADGPSARVVRGVVTDSSGASVSYTTSVQVNNVAPSVTITAASANPAGDTYSFDASATDPSAADQASLKYTWDFGDGVTATGRSASHTYTKGGTYTVRVTATDKDGGSGSATTTVTVAVNDPVPPPPSPGPVPANGLRLAFGTDTSVTPEGFTKLTPGTLFSTIGGYGWTTTVTARDRGTSDPLGASFHFGPDITFVAALTPGRYDVRITAGDALCPHDSTLSFNGVQVDSFLSQVGQFHQKVYTVDVGADGRLTVRLDGRGGVDNNAVLNALEVFPVGQLPPALVPVSSPTPPPSGGGGGSSTPVTSPRPSDGYIVTPAGYIPNFGANPTIVSAASGAWSNPATWAQGRVPGAGDVVAIAAGTTVSYDVYSNSPVTTVVVQANAHLVFRTDINTRLTVNNLLVLEQGELQIGTAANPVAAGVKAEVIFADTPLDLTRDPEQFGNGLIGLGKVTMHGQSKGDTFLRLAAEPRAGDTTLRLQSPAVGWAVGDRVLVPDTRQLDDSTRPGGWGTYTPQFEIMTIAAISADRLTLTLSAALQYDHLGARTDAGVLDLLPHVANMTRNVMVRSASNFGTRGYTLFTGRADVDIRNTTFAGMGRTKVSSLDNTTFDANWAVNHIGTNQTGRYPVQFKHLIGPEGGQANGFQYTFEGNAVVCQMDPQPFRWGIAIDDSHYGSVQNNVLYNWAGAGLAVVSGNETANVIARNFVTRTRAESNGLARADSRGFRDVGFEGVGMWLRSVGNYVRGNVVNDSLLAYLYWPVTGGTTTRIPAYQGADTLIAAQTRQIGMNTTPLTEFAGNEVYGGNTAQGLSIWNLGAGSIATPNPSQAESVVKNFTAWHVYDKVFFNYVTSRLTFDGLVARGDFAKLRKSGTAPTGLYAGDYTQENFLVKNSNIQGFLMGVIVSTFGNQQTFQNSYFSNYVNFRIDNRWGPFKVGEASPPVRILLDNVRFGAPLPPRDGYAPPANIWMNGNSREANTDLTAFQSVEVRSYNGVAGDDFRVYFREQAADYVLPTTMYNADGYLALIGAPEAGLTNQQAWDLYHIAWAGAVAPSNATTRAGINGLVART